MDDKLIQYLAPGALASAVLAFALREWDTLYDLGVKVYDRFTRDRIDAPYEVLAFDLSLDLKDSQGKKAVIKRSMKVRFLQDYVIAFQDYVWGDGDVVADYRIAPGRVVDTFRDGDRWNILVSLQKTMSRGETEEFHIERIVNDGFTSDEEWLQTETWLPTKHLRIRIIFPKKRRCRSMFVVERSRNRSTKLPLDAIKALPDGRAELLWERAKPRRGEVFTLKWQW